MMNIDYYRYQFSFLNQLRPQSLHRTGHRFFRRSRPPTAMWSTPKASAEPVAIQQLAHRPVSLPLGKKPATNALMANGLHHVTSCNIM